MREQPPQHVEAFALDRAQAQRPAHGLLKQDDRRRELATEENIRLLVPRNLLGPGERRRPDCPRKAIRSATTSPGIRSHQASVVAVGMYPTAPLQHTANVKKGDSVCSASTPAGVRAVAASSGIRRSLRTCAACKVAALIVPSRRITVPSRSVTTASKPASAFSSEPVILRP